MGVHDGPPEERPSNSCLRFRIGQRVEVWTKDGQRIAGRVSVTGWDYVVLTAGWGSATIATGHIGAYENLG